jgi:hypothetical protein
MADLDDEFEALLQRKAGKTPPPNNPVARAVIADARKMVAPQRRLTNNARCPVPQGDEFQKALDDNVQANQALINKVNRELAVKARVDEIVRSVRSGVPAPHVRNPRTPADWPKKWAPGELKMGESVWYKGERWWICNIGLDWMHTSYVQIIDSPYHPGHMIVPKGASIESVHADLLDRAPVNGSVYHKQDTKEAIEKKAMMKEKGINDIGDEVAELLRGKSLEEAYAVAAKFMDEEEEFLQGKFGHLNNGQQRMQLGNRMRNWRKKNGGS